MRKIIFFAFWLLLVTPAIAGDKWTKEDTVRQIAFTVVEGMDWLQTKEIARNPKYYETNWYLGKYPSQNKVDKYFAICTLGHALVSYLLPVKTEVYGFKVYPRQAWQYFWIGLEAGCVSHNLNIGIRISF